jgi:hypothetical protein
VYVDRQDTQKYQQPATGKWQKSAYPVAINRKYQNTLQPFTCNQPNHRITEQGKNN